MRLPLMIIVIATLLGSCNYREDKFAKAVFSDRLNYTSVREQIFKPNCYGCHSGSGAVMGIDLSNYADLMKPELGVITPGEPLNSTLYLNIQSGRMPPGGPRLTDAQTKMIFNWIAEGAREN